jgi:hypothetical protein
MMSPSAAVRRGRTATAGRPSRPHRGAQQAERGDRLAAQPRLGGCAGKVDACIRPGAYDDVGADLACLAERGRAGCEPRRVRGSVLIAGNQNDRQQRHRAHDARPAAGRSPSVARALAEVLRNSPCAWPVHHAHLMIVETRGSILIRRATRFPSGEPVRQEQPTQPSFRRRADTRYGHCR